jgi:nitroreductase
MNFNERLNQRYASKMMNGTSIEDSKINNILESIRLSPSSFGLQPYSIIVIKNRELLNKIFETTASGQPQIQGCSHLVIFAANKKITNLEIDNYLDLINKTRQMPEEKLVGFKSLMTNYLVAAPAEKNFEWAARQTYIALGFGLAAAAIEGVDSVPIEGFDHLALDKLLELDEKNLGSVSMLALGNRDAENDYNAKLPKVRKSTEDLFININ